MKQTWYSTNQESQSPDAIHQILAYGTLNDIQSLKETAGEDTVKKIFLEHPKKVYTASLLNFIKTFILHIHSSFDEQQYLKHTPRYTR